MAEDYARGMNLGGSSHFSSVIGNVKNTVNDINNLMSVSIQRASLLVNKLTQAAKELRSATDGAGTGGGSNGSHTVMNQPNVGGTRGSYEQLSLFDQPNTNNGTGGGRFGNLRNAFSSSAAPYAAGAALTGVMRAMPGANAQVEQNYLTDRSIFYGQADNINHPGKFYMDARERQYNSISAMQRSFGQRGTITDPLDASRSMAMAAQLGVQIQNASVRNGIADMSNLTPGVGLAASTQAYATLQQGSTVNRLRFMGINTRDTAGHQLGFRQIADQLWMRLNQQKSKKGPITKDDLTISLESGNALSNIVDQISGGDSVLRDQLVAALFQKASGASGSNEFSKGAMAQSGGTTAAINSLSSRTSASAQTLQDTARSGATGVMASNDVATAMSSLTNAINKLTGLVSMGSMTNNSITGIGNIGNGAVGKVAGMAGSILGMAMFPEVGIVGKLLAGLLGGKLGGMLADGGPADKNVPYIVGERGPELFVPKSDGVVVPNHLINERGRAGGGAVLGGGMTDKSNPDQFATALLGGLGVPITSASINAIKTWSRFEGGNWKNSAHYNPLNTTLREGNSRAMNSAGVQSFNSWSVGLQATIDTLKNTKGAGYENIIASLRSGKASTQDILKAINASHWTGKAGSYASAGMLGSTSDYKTNGMYSGSGGQFSQMVSSSTSNAASGNSGLGSNGMAGYFGLANSGGPSNNYNYGGVTVVVQGAKDPKATAAEVHKVLANADIINKARNK